MLFRRGHDDIDEDPSLLLTWPRQTLPNTIQPVGGEYEEEEKGYLHMDKQEHELEVWKKKKKR